MDMVDKKVFLVTKIDGKVNPTDFGTKIVTIDKFVFCRNYLHIKDLKLDSEATKQVDDRKIASLQSTVKTRQTYTRKLKNQKKNYRNKLSHFV